MVECLTSDRVIADLSLTRCTVLCPIARHFILTIKMLAQPKETPRND